MSIRVASVFCAAFLLVALLAGCSTGKSSPGVQTSRTPPEGGRDPVVADVDPSGQDVGILVDVRSAPHAEFDRVVFEFRSALPGYRVEYVSPPSVSCDSGRSLDVTGAALMRVRFSPATAHEIESRRLILQYASIREAIISCDFEGDVTWLLGLNAKADFWVTTGQRHVAINVAHPSRATKATITATPADTRTPTPTDTPTPQP